MRAGFPGFPNEAITFLRGLERHNDREWFLPRKPLFEEKLKRPMWLLVEAVNTTMKTFAPDYITDPAKAIYRFYRDTRFSKDKKPYKDHIAASFYRRGLTGQGAAGYYFHISTKHIGIGGGIYMTLPETLLAARNHISGHYEEFRKILSARPVRSLFGDMQGDQLSRPPKGFLKDHPAGDLLRYKQFLLWKELPVELATTPQLYVEIQKHFRAMAPFMDFLNKPLINARKAARLREY